MKTLSERGSAALIILGVALALIVGGWILSWVLVPLQMTSPENVRKQWGFAYEYDESLQAAARQVCGMEKALVSSGAEDKSQRQSQLLALEQNYSRIERDYNAKLRNAFEAKYIRPSDVPNRAPTLSEMKLKVCDR
ncbi:MAG: hypothetical protein Q7S12_00715 [bacterium]|nr:hypothetical protein [bacterium]